MPPWNELVDRQTGLLSPAQNRALRDTRVLMLGVGGMGMNAAANLARVGFERFTLIDCDVVDGTNANRTPFAFEDTLGLQKVEATRRYLLAINPACRVETHPGVRFGLDSDPAVMERLLADHELVSWAMDGMAGRLYFTRITHRLGQQREGGIPAVESWALPYHHCVQTVTNRAGSPDWERCFGLPTAGVPLEELDAEAVRRAQLAFFRTLAGTPRLFEDMDPELVERWVRLRIPNRSLGPAVVGCGALIAMELMANALSIAGLPLPNLAIHEAPWLAVTDLRRNVSYEIDLARGRMRWRHPVTLELHEQDTP
jgi:hypothetical protein